MKLRRSGLIASGSEDAEGEPSDGSKQAEPAEVASRGADLLVAEHEAPMAEEDGPIVVAGTDEGKSLRAGVGHIDADIEEIFEEPEGAKGDGGGFAFEPEIHAAEERHEKFRERAAENHDDVAEPREKEVAAFVDDEVDVIEEKEARAVERGVEKEEEVDDKPSDPGGKGDGFPGGKIIGEKTHGPRVAGESALRRTRFEGVSWGERWTERAELKEATAKRTG